MLGLYLITAHLIGDYLLQTRWQSANKFGWTLEAMRYRNRHVLAYLLPFIPIAFVYADVTSALTFLVLLGLLHFLTDAQRFVSTPGEWLVAKVEREALPPNPWPSLPLAIDQSLHIVQIAVLGGLFLT